MKGSEDNLQESALLFYHVGSETRTQILGLSKMCLYYPLSHLTSSVLHFKTSKWLIGPL